MSGLHGTLQRFRSAGAPGPPTAGAVPADRQAEEAAELVPVFALLDEAQLEAREIRAHGDASAAEIRATAVCEAEAVVQEALDRAVSVRDESRQQARALAEARVEAMLAGAREEAAAIGRRARQRIDECVRRIVAEAVAQLGGGDEPAGQPSADEAPIRVRRIL